MRTISRRMKVTFASVTIAAGVLGVAACTTSGANTTGASNENAQSGDIWTHYEQVQPLLSPTGKSVIRDTLTWAEAIQILGLNTHSFVLRKGGNGGPVFDCPSVGSAIANTSQLSNPMFVEPDPNEGSATQPGSILVPNMDPDGIYPPASSQGTYVKCLLPDGTPYLMYAEPDVVQLSVSGAVWDPSLYGGQGGIRITGGAVNPVCQVRYISNPNYTGSAAQASSNASAAPGADTSDKTIPVTNCVKPK